MQFRPEHAAAGSAVGLDEPDSTVVKLDPCSVDVVREPADLAHLEIITSNLSCQNIPKDRTQQWVCADAVVDCHLQSQAMRQIQMIFAN